MTKNCKKAKIVAEPNYLNSNSHNIINQSQHLNDVYQNNNAILEVILLKKQNKGLKKKMKFTKRQMKFTKKQLAICQHSLDKSLDKNQE